MDTKMEGVPSTVPRTVRILTSTHTHTRTLLYIYTYVHIHTSLYAPNILYHFSFCAFSKGLKSSVTLSPSRPPPAPAKILFLCRKEKGREKKRDIKMKSNQIAYFVHFILFFLFFFRFHDETSLRGPRG